MNNKISYDDYFLSICFLIAQRSIDPSTKCGAVLVSADKRILSTGYNGPIKGSKDELVPLERPAKYAHMIHSEENCLLSYFGSAQDLIDSTIYITGAPCHDCLRKILQKGIYKIVYPDGNLAVMQDQEEQNICKLMSVYGPPFETRILSNLPNVVGILEQTQTYIYQKNPGKFAR